MNKGSKIENNREVQKKMQNALIVSPPRWNLGPITDLMLLWALKRGKVRFNKLFCCLCCQTVQSKLLADSLPSWSFINIQAFYGGTLIYGFSAQRI